ILEIARTVRDLLGDVDILHTEARAGDFGGKEVSSERARTELDWCASTPFREGVRRYVEWRRSNDPVDGALPERELVPQPAARWRERLVPRLPLLPVPAARRVLGTAALAGIIAWGVASDDAFSAFASLLGARPATSVRTSRPQVGLLVDAASALSGPTAPQRERPRVRAAGATNGVPAAVERDAARRRRRGQRGAGDELALDARVGGRRAERAPPPSRAGGRAVPQGIAGARPGYHGGRTPHRHARPHEGLPRGRR